MVDLDHYTFTYPFGPYGRITSDWIRQYNFHGENTAAAVEDKTAIEIEYGYEKQGGLVVYVERTVGPPKKLIVENVEARTPGIMVKALTLSKADKQMEHYVLTVQIKDMDDDEDDPTEFVTSETFMIYSYSEEQE